MIYEVEFTVHANVVIRHKGITLKDWTSSLLQSQKQLSLSGAKLIANASHTQIYNYASNTLGVFSTYSPEPSVKNVSKRYYSILRFYG